jgi:hypothetical protein
VSSYLVPIPAAKKRSGKLQFEESTGDRILENAFMNRMRGKVGVWRTGGVGNPGRGQQRALPITLTPHQPLRQLHRHLERSRPVPPLADRPESGDLILEQYDELS